MPCLLAFWDEVFLPLDVRGPVDFLALRLLALVWALLAMGCHVLDWLCGLGLPEFKVRHEAPRPAVQYLNSGLEIIHRRERPEVSRRGCLGGLELAASFALNICDFCPDDFCTPALEPRDLPVGRDNVLGNSLADRVGGPECRHLLRPDLLE